MRMTIKNKNMLGLEKLAREAYEKNGTPDFAFMDEREMFGFLTEVKYHIKEKLVKRDLLQITDRDGVDVTKDFFLGDVRLFVDFWLDGSYIIKYRTRHFIDPITILKDAEYE